MSNFNTSITRTLYGSELQTAQFLGIPYVISAKSTLNELFGVETSAVLGDNIYPTVNCFTIGFGGHAQTIGADGTPLTSEVPHLATNVSNYKPLPFVMRQVNDDLSPQEKARYAMRVLKEINGVSYYAYYLRRIDKTNVATQKQIHTLNNDGSTTVVAFVPGDADLVPTPPDLSNAGINVLQAKHAVVTAPLTLVLSTQEIAEIIDASMILYGDDRYAQITELAVVTSVDKNVVLSDQTTFKEAVHAQIAAFTGAAYQLRYINTTLTTTLDAGVSGPLLKVQPV